MGEEELLTAGQVAERLHMRQDSVARKIRRGEIEAVKIGRQWLIRRDTLERLLEPPAPQGQSS